MNLSLSGLLMASVSVYAAGCIFYVYRVRGRVRYSSLQQYLRKSWPIFAPLNCILYAATPKRARRPVSDADYLPDIGVIRANWKTIRDEAVALDAAGGLDSTVAPHSIGYFDLGFRTFFKRGWKKFYLKWYGDRHPSAQRLCPETVRLLEQVPGIRAAMFSLLPAGAELSQHSDPLACSFRYHLGLRTPNSERCFINVDGENLVWRDGEDFVFDETYPHHAKNGTDGPRLILMCDVERPMNLAGRSFNKFYARIAKEMRVPNTAEDDRGLLTRLFAAVAPLRERALKLKGSRRRTYMLLKMALNTTLLSLCLLPVYAAMKMLERGLDRIM